jgi:adenylate kinase family enzyme
MEFDKTLKKILIFGNSASGKSTLAKNLSAEYSIGHLDLDLLAWLPTSPPTRKNLVDSKTGIDEFLIANTQWVIEGCYTDLLELVATQASEIIFLDLPIETCIANARARPWEPHKYSSKIAQDKNLAMLIDWISQYTKREDTFSRNAHLAFYDKFSGGKTSLISNSDL